MHILVLNSGSATLKFQLFETAGLQSLARGSIEASGDYAQAALSALAQLRAILGEARTRFCSAAALVSMRRKSARVFYPAWSGAG